MATRKVYYIVNPAGAVHTVSYEHAKARLGQIGYRMADKKEIEAYKSQKLQRFQAPIAEPFSTEPEAVEEPEPVEESDDDGKSGSKSSSSKK